MIERLLASPGYGERWGRHWLDLARYAESDGHGADRYRPEAWRYRDYVIRSFNDDKPYDRFILEQLAGDEVAPGDFEALTATGFLRHWIYENNQREIREVREIILNDVTDVTADVFLGLGFGCARCHDHKFDPILQEDYYRLQAFFAPMLPRDDIITTGTAEQERLPGRPGALAGGDGGAPATDRSAREARARLLAGARDPAAAPGPEGHLPQTGGGADTARPPARGLDRPAQGRRGAQPRRPVQDDGAGEREPRGRRYASNLRSTTT